MERRQFLASLAAAPASLAGSSALATSPGSTYQIDKSKPSGGEYQRPRFALCRLDVPRPERAPDSLIDVMDHDGSDVTWNSAKGLRASREDAFGRCANRNADILCGKAGGKFGWWVVVQLLSKPHTTAVVTLESDGEGDVTVSEDWCCRLVRPSDDELAEFATSAELREAFNERDDDAQEDAGYGANDVDRADHCQIVISSPGGERIVEPCSTRIGAEAYVEFYNSSKLRGDSVASIRELAPGMVKRLMGAKAGAA